MIYDVNYREQFPPVAKFKEYIALIDTTQPPTPEKIERGEVGGVVKFYQVCYVEPVPVLEFTEVLTANEKKEGVELKFYDPRANDMRYPYVGSLELLHLRFEVIGWARVYLYYPRQASRMKLKEIITWFEPGTMPAQKEVYIMGDKMKIHMDVYNMLPRRETVKIRAHGWRLQLTEYEGVPPMYTPVWIRGAEIKSEEW